ncbi:protein farnesyltransferase [Malassezia vespertilionis]|nr:protein farnesyltransferase [Malassezia vespertilionis]WFD06092.1 protein farnesyltransferase [Malassezia vespertilionis]
MLEPLPAPFVAFDSNRAWIIYWVAHALDLMGMPLQGAMRVRAVSTLLHFQDPHGGFGGGPGQLGHLMSTYAAVCALAILGKPGGMPSEQDIASDKLADGRGGWDCIDRKRIYAWMMRLKQPDGAFLVHDQGEIDVRATYCVVVIASLLGIATEALFQGVADHIASCQTYEGGFAALSCSVLVIDHDTVRTGLSVHAQPPQGEAHGGYAFCASAAYTQLCLAGKSSRVDTRKLVRWATSLQGTPYEGGGFRGRTNKLVDGCYGWFCGGGLMTCLEALVFPPMQEPAQDMDLESSSSWESAQEPELFDRAALAAYILVVAQAPLTGGLRDKPGKRADAYHTCYNLSGLSLTQHKLRPSVQQRREAEAQLAHAPALLRALYGASLAWAPTDVPEKDALAATHPVFNVGLTHVAQMMAHWYIA